MNLPSNPTDLAALLRQIEERARELADKQDRATFKRRPDIVRDAVDCAVTSLYFYGGPSKANTALERIVALLAPEIATVMDNQGVNAAYRILHPEEET